METCKICLATLEKAVYVSPANFSLTSLCEVLPGKTEVFFCGHCGHLQTSELENLSQYYDQAYKILIESVDEDQLYEVSGDTQTFRFDHQARVLLSKVNLAPGAFILDYGCAKSTTLKLLTRRRPDLVPHLFDVSEMYVPFWQLFAAPENWATYKPKPAWQGRFDVVTSFFAFEHVSDPRAELASIAALLKTDGVFYCIVPNVYANTADFVVADHVHHYSPSSLERLLSEQGFSLIEIDGQAHHSAFVVTARKSAGTVAAAITEPTDGLLDSVTEMAAYWAGFAEKVRTFERAHGPTGKAAIYGSGFYGTFVATCLQERNRVSCFIDRNSFRQGKTLLGLPIVAPEEIPADVTLVYVGLNPVHAREEIAKVQSWRGRTLTYFYP